LANLLQAEAFLFQVLISSFRSPTFLCRQPVPRRIGLTASSHDLAIFSEHLLARSVLRIESVGFLFLEFKLPTKRRDARFQYLALAKPITLSALGILLARQCSGLLPRSQTSETIP
jgi:hypothetical protein